MNLKSNPDYKEVFKIIDDGQEIRFYHPQQGKDYHVQRYVSAQAMNVYASAGITPQLLDTLMDAIIAKCNDTKASTSTLRTDIAILANNVKYRTKYPVDEDCTLRMAAIYTFMEDENPDKVDNAWTNRKVMLAKKHPELYAFFLSVGAELTPAYKEQLQALSDSDYFLRREESLQALIPQG